MNLQDPLGRGGSTSGRVCISQTIRSAPRPYRLPSFKLCCQDDCVFFAVFQLELPAKGVNLLFVKDCEGFLLSKQFLCIEYSLYEVGLKLVSLIFILACTHGMSKDLLSPLGCNVQLGSVDDISPCCCFPLLERQVPGASQAGRESQLCQGSQWEWETPTRPSDMPLLYHNTMWQLISSSLSEVICKNLSTARTHTVPTLPPTPTLHQPASSAVCKD